MTEVGRVLIQLAFAVVGAALSALTLALAVRTFQVSIRLLGSGRQAPGRVVDYRTTRSKNRVLYIPTVEYRTALGEDVRAAPSMWAQTSREPPYGAVIVYYDEDRPSRIRVAGAGLACDRSSFVRTLLSHLLFSALFAATAGAMAWVIVSKK